MDTKAWYESKTLWTSIVGAAFGAAAAFHVALPPALTQEKAVAGVMIGFSVVHFVLRLFTKKPIG